MTLEHDEHYSKHRILAIDPGSIATGISIYYMDNEVIEGIDAFTVKPARTLLKLGKCDEDPSERNTRILLLKKIFCNILTDVKPSIVISESPFYNPRMPGAYGALVEVLSVFRTSTYEYDPAVNFFTVEPLLVKKGIGAKTVAGKLDMKIAIRMHQEIFTKLMVELEDLDEHGVDAIAVGYTWIKNALEVSE